MILFEWLSAQPTVFINEMIHVNMVIACLSLSIVFTLIACKTRKKAGSKVAPRSNSDAASKKTTKGETERSHGTGTTESKKDVRPTQQPSSAAAATGSGAGDEEKGTKKKKNKSKEAVKPDEPKGSIRISIHGDQISSSEGIDDQIFMHEVFDDVTAQDTLFPDEIAERQQQQKEARKKKSVVPSAIQPTQYDSDRVEPTQPSNDVPTVDTDLSKDQDTRTGISSTVTQGGEASVSEQKLRSRSSSKAQEQSKTGSTGETESTKKKVRPGRKIASNVSVQKTQQPSKIHDTASQSTTHNEDNSSRP
ncbi:hypothetical protein PFISCL1PPCAC_23217, partial [Pristionchus fissidentatus]